MEIATMILSGLALLAATVCLILLIQEKKRNQKRNTALCDLLREEFDLVVDYICESKVNSRNDFAETFGKLDGIALRVPVGDGSVIDVTLELSKKDIDVFANNLAVSFKGYPLFEYFANDKYDIKKMKKFWKVSLKTMSDKTFFLADSEDANSLAIFSP